MSDGKALSLWIQSTQIWRINRKNEGLSQAIPKRGTPEHGQIITIMDSLKSGENIIDPDMIKTKSISKPKRAAVPKIYASTHRTGAPTRKGRRVYNKRSELEIKRHAKEVKDADDLLKETRKKFDKNVEGTQAEMIKLLAKLESGKVLSPEETKEITSKIASLSLPLRQQEEQLKTLEEVTRLKREAQGAEALKNLEDDKRLKDTVDRKRQYDEDKETERLLAESISRSSSSPGSDPKKIIQYHAVQTSINRFIANKSDHLPNDFLSKMKPYVMEGAQFHTGSAENTAKVLQEIDRLVSLIPPAPPGSRPKVLKYSRDQVEHAFAAPPVPDVPDVPIITSTPELEAAVENLTTVAEQPASSSSEGTVSGATETPLTNAIAQTTGTTDAASLAEAAQIVHDAAVATPAEEAEASTSSSTGKVGGHGLQLSPDPYLLPGSRNSGPINLGRGYSGPKITAGMLRPGSRNTGNPHPLGGIGIGGNISVSPGRFQTNPEALLLAQELEIEIARLRQLARTNTAVIISNPGQSPH